MSINLEALRLTEQLEQWKALRVHLRHLQLVRDLCRDMGYEAVYRTVQS